MEPIVFKTASGNSYLYSPSVKALMPIAHNDYEHFKSGAMDNDFLLLLRDRGYLDNYFAPLDGKISRETIEQALIQLPQIVFETTTNCNLSCSYCCYGEGYDTFDSRRTQMGSLSFQTAKCVIDYFVKIFARVPVSNAPKEPFAISFYGGEPLLNFDVVQQIVQYAESVTFNNRDLFFTMTTNGVLLAKYADFLAHHKFKMLISLDGNVYHDSYRVKHNGSASFGIVMANLEQVKVKHPQWFSTFRFNAVYTDRSDVGEVVRWFRGKFNKTPNFSPLHMPTKGAKESQRIVSMLKKLVIPEAMAKDHDLVTQNPLFNRILIFTSKLFGNHVAKEYNLWDDLSTNIPTGTCIPFTKRLFVSFDGKLHPCEKVSRDIPLGEVNRNGDVIIDCSKVADQFMTQLSRAKGKCQHCYMQLCCTKCALCYSDGICDEFTDKRKFTNLLSQAVSYIEQNPDIIQLLNDNIILK
jgi:putative dehydrogenase